jgi:hypothetical protein
MPRPAPLPATPLPATAPLPAAAPADLEERCGDTPGNTAHFLKIGGERGGGGGGERGGGVDGGGRR